MTTLKFADTHNMVAFLSKPAESKGFEQIVDFLNAHPIKNALTVNPTIYTSCIEQFWATIKAKTVNGEVQLQALVDGKKIIITESTVRRDLQLEYAEGVDCLPNATIFEQLALMGYEQVSQKLTFYKAFFSSQCSGPRRQETIGDTITQTRFENVSKLSNDPLLARDTSERRVKKLEKKDRSRTHKLKRLYKVGLSARVESYRDEKDLGEDASKQGRISDIDDDAGITLVSTHFDADTDMFGVHDLIGDEVVVESEVVVKASKKRNVVEEVVVCIDGSLVTISSDSNGYKNCV
ncbi:hypothetical protein Tco_0801590 [Tanacetum coccineum]|uniref:Xylulose kinase-1 n=1 Tax=Tanacetum coccineum TaxID=301880 RepID=A0ABQ4ZX88_9ASTR